MFSSCYLLSCRSYKTCLEGTQAFSKTLSLYTHQRKPYAPSSILFLSMSIQILPASSQDAGDVARLVILGNADDPVFTRIVSHELNATPGQQAEQLRWRTERNRSNMQRRGAHWFKAVDTSTSESVGFAGVVAPQSEESKWDGKLSETMDEKWFGVYMRDVGEKKEALVGGREDVWCESCDSR
jgi:hypothetical protein